jgi:hypothetical protein
VSLNYAKAVLSNLSNYSLVQQNYEITRYYLSSTLSLPSVPNSFKQSLGQSIDEFFISCTFNQQPCNMSLWVWYWDSYWGNCFRFNSGLDNTGTTTPTLLSTKGLKKKYFFRKIGFNYYNEWCCRRQNKWFAT